MIVSSEWGRRLSLSDRVCDWFSNCLSLSEGMIMRTELYEQYKQAHPEEMHEVNALFAYDQTVRAVRARARDEKLVRVNKWIRLLEQEDKDGEDRSDS